MEPWNKIKDFDVELFLELEEEGHTMGEIAKMMHMDVSTLCACRKRHNVYKPHKNRFDRSLFLRLQRQGYSLKQIAELMGYSVIGLRVARKRWGLPIQGEG